VPPNLQPIRLLHVSDLHLGTGEFDYIDGKLRLPLADDDRYKTTKLFWDSLEHWPSIPDVIIVSGDITVRCHETGFKQFQEQMVALRQKVKDPGRIVVVPGNHDVKWSVDENLSNKERYKLFAEAAGEFTRPWLSEIDPALEEFEKTRPESLRRRPYFFDPEAGILVYALNSASLSGTVADPDETATKLIKVLKKSIPKNGKSRKASDEPQKAVDRLWRHLSLHDAPAVGAIQLKIMHRSLTDLKKVHKERYDRAVKIVVMHHHLNHIPAAGVELKTTEMVLDGGPLKSALMDHGFQMVLHGHKHVWHVAQDTSGRDPHSSTEGSNSGLLVVSSGTVGGFPAVTQKSCFNWIEIMPGGAPGHRDVHIRRCDLQQTKFTTPAYVWIEESETVKCDIHIPEGAPSKDVRIEQFKKSAERFLEHCIKATSFELLDHFSRLLATPVQSSAPLADPTEMQDLIDKLHRAVKSEGTSLYAIDVLGPQLWLNPEAFTYFSIQFIPYVQASDVSLDKNGILQSRPILSPRVCAAIKRARANATGLWGNSELRKREEDKDRIDSLFTSEDGIIEGKPKFEIARVVIWPSSLLNTPTAQAVIRLHEGFNIPLFYLDMEEPSLGMGAWRDPRVDYCLKCEGDKLHYGFFGYTTFKGMFEVSSGIEPPHTLYHYRPDAREGIKTSRNPGYKSLLHEFNAFLDNRTLLMARDALYLNRANRLGG